MCRIELGIHQMPIFKRSTSAVINVDLPRPEENEPPIKLNVAEDLKMYLRFVISLLNSYYSY